MVWYLSCTNCFEERKYKKMKSNQSILDDVFFQQYDFDQLERVAYVDECGSFGFDFNKEGTSKYYVLCSIIVRNDKLEKLHADFDCIKKKSGFENAELKSSNIKDNKRSYIMNLLLPLDFSVILFIADKEKFIKKSPITEYRPSFIKFLDQHLYNLLYQAYPRLKIIQDKVGCPEFQDSFRKYVEDKRPNRDLFNQYEFDFVDSKDETLVQLADFIAGSITKSLLDEKSINYFDILRGKITSTEHFPYENEPYWGNVKPDDVQYNESIFKLAIKSAMNFIKKYENVGTDDRKMQIEVLRYLLNYVFQIDSTAYVYSDELVSHLKKNMRIKVVRNTLFRRVIAPLRDEGVILASCSKGYKIPISVKDIMTYLNQSLATVGPMVQRMGICRKLVKQGTDGKLDLFDDAALIRFKRYFDEKT